MRRCIAAALGLVLLCGVLGPDADARRRRRRLPSITPACDTDVASSAKLAADVGSSVTPCTGDGLRITGEGVTLDMNGHTIWGSGAGTGLRFLGPNTTVRDGVVRGFGVGISSAVSGPNVSLSNVQSLSNAGHGIDIAGRISLSGVISDENGDDGLHATGSRMVVKNSTFNANGESGAEFAGSSVRVTNTDAHNNTEGGLFLEDVGGARVIGNRASGNTTFGIGVYSVGSGAVVSRNHVHDNTLDGINGAGPGADISRNVATSNSEAGIEWRHDGTHFERNITNGNATGIFAGGENLRFVRNRAEGNGGNGLRTFIVATLPINDGSGIRFIKNVTRGNGFASPNLAGLGIDAIASALPTGKKNRSSGNDDPDQCEPVTVMCSP